jgi:hypothetical protein
MWGSGACVQAWGGGGVALSFLLFGDPPDKSGLGVVSAVLITCGLTLGLFGAIGTYSYNHSMMLTANVAGVPAQTVKPNLVAPLLATWLVLVCLSLQAWLLFGGHDGIAAGLGVVVLAIVCFTAYRARRHRS